MDIKCGPARVQIRIDPAVGTHKLDGTNLFEGWRVVAKITLVDTQKDATLPLLKLTRQRPVLYWFVGPDAAGEYIESRYYNTVDDLPTETVARLRYWERTSGGGPGSPGKPTDPKAVFKKEHPGKTPVEFRKGGGGGGGGGGGSTSAAVRTYGYGLMWFECDPGCCG